MERIARGNFRPGRIEELLRSAGLTKDQLRQYVINRPATPRTPSPPPAPRGRGRGRGRGGVPPGGGGGDDDGGPPGVAVVAAAVAVEGDVVAVAAALPLDDERA